MRERAIAIPVYVVIVAAALWRRAAYRKRLLAFFVAVYFWVAVTNVAAPRGPYAQVGLIVLPILVLVLFGARASRMAILASATIFASAAFLRALPGVATTLAIDPSQRLSRGLVFVQAIMLPVTTATSN